ncbi:hypothetical protein A3J11_02920 [Candidatus Kaiserbacteria bacterium RIFCSPLOWO2_02_FULL_55_12]|uniref:Uncharacterized protein n=2 Tax=Candidatus Kaiseribacteriota TaxID=1752734 RepID=A0A1F6EZ91_9BACT|nr:MAG: hypothetical protein A3C94_02035 [Candidatus Kaiserbacteria bacterium RIFCSPHIGHO2_02_FULL_55_17]OGG78935.1 MAG: hypothetical protein A3J11_02920 [Candidatus Kaiserbacteria bacterium RIFCSPLOWO2_02_FULL_55_12]
MHKAGNATLFYFFEQEMKMIFNKSKNRQEHIRIAFWPMKRAFKSFMDMCIMQITIPIRRGEAVVEMCQHKQESKSISFIANNRQPARSSLNNVNI